MSDQKNARDVTPSDEQTLRKQIHDIVLYNSPNDADEVTDQILALLSSREAEAYRRGQVEEVKILQKAMYPHKGALNILGNELKLLSQQSNKEEK